METHHCIVILCWWLYIWCLYSHQNVGTCYFVTPSTRVDQEMSTDLVVILVQCLLASWVMWSLWVVFNQCVSDHFKHSQCYNRAHVMKEVYGSLSSMTLYTTVHVHRCIMYMYTWSCTCIITHHSALHVGMAQKKHKGGSNQCISRYMLITGIGYSVSISTYHTCKYISSCKFSTEATFRWMVMWEWLCPPCMCTLWTSAIPTSPWFIFFKLVCLLQEKGPLDHYCTVCIIIRAWL